MFAPRKDVPQSQRIAPSNRRVVPGRARAADENAGKPENADRPENARENFRWGAAAVIAGLAILVIAATRA